jgi:hypothetical protein
LALGGEVVIEVEASAQMLDAGQVVDDGEDGLDDHAGLGFGEVECLGGEKFQICV